MTEMEKTAMFNGFFHELDSILDDQEMVKRASAFFAKHAKMSDEEKDVTTTLGGGVVGAVGGASVAGVRNVKAYSKVLDRIGKMHKKHLDRPYEHRNYDQKLRGYSRATAAAHRMNEHAFQKSEKALARSMPLWAAGGAAAGLAAGKGVSKLLFKSKSKEKKAWAPPSWVAPTLGHFAVGAVPGAIAGAATARPEERKRGAVKGALVGGAVGVGGGHLLRVAQRDSQALHEAARAHKYNDIGAVPKDARQKVYQHAQGLKADRPLYGTKTAGVKSWVDSHFRRAGEEVGKGVADHLKKYRGRAIAGGAAFLAANSAGSYYAAKKGAEAGTKKRAEIIKISEPSWQVLLHAKKVHPSGKVSVFKPGPSKKKLMNILDGMYEDSQRYSTRPPKSKTSAKKDDGWERPSDSAWAKHKGKILGGAVALATAAGAAHHIHKHTYRPTPHDVPKKVPWYLKRWAAKVRVKRTNEPFTPRGWNPETGKVGPIREVHVHRRHAPAEHHAETAVRRAAGEHVTSANTTAHADEKSVHHKTGPNPTNRVRKAS